MDINAYTLPDGWTWKLVKDDRSRWNIPANFAPLAVGGRAVAWGMWTDRYPIPEV